MINPVIVSTLFWRDDPVKLRWSAKKGTEPAPIETQDPEPSEAKPEAPATPHTQPTKSGWGCTAKGLKSIPVSPKIDAADGGTPGLADLNDLQQILHNPEISVDSKVVAFAELAKKLGAGAKDALNRIAADKKLDVKLRDSILNSLEKSELCSAGSLFSLVTDPTESKELRSDAGRIFSRSSSPRLNLQQLRTVISLLKDKRAFDEYDPIADLLGPKHLPSLAHLSDQELRDLLKLSVKWSNYYTLLWPREAAGHELLRRDPSHTSFLVDIIGSYSQEECAKGHGYPCYYPDFKTPLTKYGDAGALDLVTGQGSPVDILTFAAQLEKRGALKPADLNKTERTLSRLKFETNTEAALKTFIYLGGAKPYQTTDYGAIQDMGGVDLFTSEAELKSFTASAAAAPLTKAMVQRLVAQIERRRKTMPVFPGALKRVGRANLGTDRPRTADTRVFDLALFVLKTPPAANQAGLIIVDPNGKKWLQNSFRHGPHGSEWTERGNAYLSGGNETAFRVFLNTGNKQVEAYLKYYDKSDQFLGVSNSFKIDYPTPK